MKSNETVEFLQELLNHNNTKISDIPRQKINPTVIHQNDHAITYGNHDKSGRFVVKSAAKSSKALVICRASPIVPVGIQTLNLVLDPSKTEARKQKLIDMKKRYYEDFGFMDIEKSYKKLFELLWYTRLPCFDIEGITSKQRDDMSVIKRCYWRGQIVDCASVFVTRSTDRGMCCAFNQVNADQIYKNTSYRRVASSMQQQDKEHSFGSINLTSRYNMNHT